MTSTPLSHTSNVAQTLDLLGVYFPIAFKKETL